MATYVLLLTLTPAGRERTLADPEYLFRAVRETEVDEVDSLGLYAVLGRFDFVCIVSAPSNEAAARYSVELGCRTGTHVETLPAVSIGDLDSDDRVLEAEQTLNAPPN